MREGTIEVEGMEKDETRISRENDRYNIQSSNTYTKFITTKN